MIWWKKSAEINVRSYILIQRLTNCRCLYLKAALSNQLNYKRTLSVGPGGVWTHSFPLSSPHSSNSANQVEEKLKQGYHQGTNPGCRAPKAIQPTVHHHCSSNYWSFRKSEEHWSPKKLLANSWPTVFLGSSSSLLPTTLLANWL